VESKQHVVGFIGAGNMAEALARGLRKAGLGTERIAASDPSPERRRVFEEISARVFESNLELLKCATFVVLAVKPQVLPSVLAEIAPEVQPSTPVLSIAAGIEVAFVRHFLPDASVVRAMPNTPCLVGAGMSVLYAPPEVPREVRRTAEDLLATCGRTAWVNDEAQLDAVTALSGSGPAYFFYLCELLQEAAVQVGLPPELAPELSRRTCIGSAALLERTGEDPSELRRRVTSPGGTTEAALKAFLGGGLPSLVKQAVEAAALRSSELRKEAWRSLGKESGSETGS